MTFATFELFLCFEGLIQNALVPSNVLRFPQFPSVSLDFSLYTQQSLMHLTFFVFVTRVSACFGSEGRWWSLTFIVLHVDIQISQLVSQTILVYRTFILKIQQKQTLLTAGTWAYSKIFYFFFCYFSLSTLYPNLRIQHTVFHVSQAGFQLAVILSCPPLLELDVKLPHPASATSFGIL